MTRRAREDERVRWPSLGEQVKVEVRRWIRRSGEQKDMQDSNQFF